MKTCNLKNGLAVIIGFLFIFNYSISYGWDNDSTHIEMTVAAIEYLRDRADIPQALKEEVGRNFSFLTRGAQEEDIPLHRAWFHFSPRLNTFSDYATCDSVEWGFNGTACLSASADFFGGSELANFAVENNEFRWIDAVNNPRTQTGWIAMGHILHLLEDLGVPDHTRNDPHPFWSIESVAGENSLRMPGLSENLVNFSSPQDFFT